MYRRVVAFVLASSLLFGAQVAGAATPDLPTAADPNFIFAAGGTPLSNGVFFPGTAVYQNGDFQGVPYQIKQGTDVTFVNVDPSAVANDHRIVSIKRKRGKPLFQSKLIAGPDQTVMKTSHVKPGVYPYLCSVHFGMFGLLEVAP